MLSGVQTGNGTSHDKYNIRGIAHAHTKSKDNISIDIDKAHLGVPANKFLFARAVPANNLFQLGDVKGSVHTK